MRILGRADLLLAAGGGREKTVEEQKNGLSPPSHQLREWCVESRHFPSRMKHAVGAAVAWRLGKKGAEAMVVGENGDTIGVVLGRRTSDACPWCPRFRTLARGVSVFRLWERQV